MNRSFSNRPKEGCVFVGSRRPGEGLAMSWLEVPGTYCRRVFDVRHPERHAGRAGRQGCSAIFQVGRPRTVADALGILLLRFFFFLLVQSGLLYTISSKCVCEITDKILTHCNNVCKWLTFYVKNRFAISFCLAGAAKDASAQGGGMEGRLVFRVWHALLMVCLLWPLSALAENSYVGTFACKDCHEEQYENFTKFAKKAHSDRSVKVMASDLTEAELQSCYGCHSTGYGQPGGFVSYEKTPHLADAGCEVCHGPGYEHVESGGDTELIKGKLTMDDCVGCHNADRVKAFNFKPLLYGGAH